MDKKTRSGIKERIGNNDGAGEPFKDDKTTDFEQIQSKE